MTNILLLPNLFSQDTAIVEDEAHHHLFRVKRHQVGDRLRVVDGEGRARWAEVIAIDRRTARLALGEVAPANEPGIAVEIFVAAPKPDRASWLVEKATELGVVGIHFVSTDREARSMEASQLGRLRRIAVSAVEQSGRAVVPQVVSAGDLRGAVVRTRASGVPIAVLDALGAGARPVVEDGGRIGLFVGPEGGWSPEERAFFDELGLPAFALGPTVLRVETAVVVGAGLLLCGDGVSR